MKLQLVSTIRNQVYQLLKEEICSGGFDPGQKLLENELAQRYSVSRSPVREAMRQLVSDGLVEEVPNKGVFVKKLSDKDVEEIYDVRVLLESYAMENIPGGVSSGDAQALQEVLSKMEAVHKRNDMTTYIQLDTELHDKLVHLCGNSIIVELYERVCGRVQQFRGYALNSDARYVDSLDEHRMLVKYLVEGEIQKAKEINTRHLSLMRNEVMDYVRHLNG